MRWILAVLFVFVPLTIMSQTSRKASQQKTEAKPADAIFVNGRIYIGNTSSVPALPSQQQPGFQAAGATAIAVQDGKILAVGTDAVVRKLAGPNTEVIDLGGHFVMPGFNDAHLHLASAGFGKLDVDLVGADSEQEMLRRIAARVKTAEPGEWIVGRGWDHTKWKKVELPDRYDLDKVTGDHPGVFIRVDGHISVANSAALKLGGVTKDTPAPEGGKIDRDAKGNPTGILRETARDLVEGKIPPPTPQQRLRAAQLALEDAAHWGLTSAQDYSDWEDFLAYEQLEREGKLTLRISEWLTFDQPLDQLDQERKHHPQDDAMLHTAMLKGFMDGSLGSRTAALLKPYSDDRGNSGLPRYTQEQLTPKTVERAKAGFQIGFHAIGDRGVEMALEAFAAAEKAMGRSDQRFRIEHAQVTTPEQIQRFADLHVIASMQANHLLTDMNWAMARLGRERASTSYAWRSFLRHGVPLAFGTDYPVEPVTPFRGLYAAVTRKNEAGDRSYFPEEKLTIDQAISAYTFGAAYAQFAEKEKGLLIPGMLADFVVLDRNLTQIPPEQILQTRVLRTVVGGKTVYQADAGK